jgi:hypothetical protein
MHHVILANFPPPSQGLKQPYPGYVRDGLNALTFARNQTRTVFRR